jgi:hypothetical protein
VISSIDSTRLQAGDRSTHSSTDVTISSRRRFISGGPCGMPEQYLGVISS